MSTYLLGRVTSVTRGANVYRRADESYAPQVLRKKSLSPATSAGGGMSEFRWSGRSETARVSPKSKR